MMRVTAILLSNEEATELVNMQPFACYFRDQLLDHELRETRDEFLERLIFLPP